MVESGGRTYLFSTAPDINVRSSADRVTWRFEPRVFTFANGQPPWMDAIGVGGDLWAPDIIAPAAGGTAPYLLFYSRNIGAGATEQSVCGVATAPSVTGPWTDQMALFNVNVIASSYRVIDPAPSFDAQGHLWVAVGSFGSANAGGIAAGGIRVFQLNPQTGKLMTAGDPGTRIAGWLIEGAFLYQRDNFYYLFFNQAACCLGLNSTYYIRVGRATSITGPYADMDGAALLNPASGGTLFMGRQFEANYTGAENAAVARPNTGAIGREIGPGHAAIMRAADGIERVSYHFYDASTGNGEPTLGIKTVLFGADGWPRPGWDLAEGTIAIGTRLNADPGATAAYWLDGSGSAPALASYTGATSQLWDVHHVDLNRFTLISHASGQALAAGAGGTVTLAAASATDNAQRWFIEQTSDASFRLLNVGSGMALQLPAGTAVRGAVPQTGAYGVNLSNQRWFLTPAGGYRIRSLNSNQYLTASAATAGASVAQQALAANNSQYFWLIPQADGYSAIVNVASGLSLAVAAASKADGAAVELEADTGSDGQRWSADGLTDGSIRLLPKASAKALEVANASTQAGALAQQGRWTHVLNQQWALEFVASVGPPPTLGGGSNGAGGASGAGGTAGGAGGARGTGGSAGTGGTAGGGGATDTGGATGAGSGGATSTGGTTGGGAGGNAPGTGGRTSGGTAGSTGVAGNGGGAGANGGNASGGCSCGVASGAAPAGSALALGSLWVLIAFRRRRRRAGPML